VGFLDILSIVGLCYFVSNSSAHTKQITAEPACSIRICESHL
jgi:hypothetical protein